MKLFKLYKIGGFYHSLPTPLRNSLKKLRLHILAKRVLTLLKYGLKDSEILTNYYNLRISFKYDSTLELRNAYLPQIQDGMFQPQTVKVFEQIIEKNDVIIDCGCNFGFFSLLACQLTGENGKVYALDASKGACESLIENSRLNNFENLVISNYAVSDVSNKEYSFFGDAGGGTVIKDNPGYETTKPSGKVFSVSLDDYFSKKAVGKLKLIKIDVEGCEYFVLKGMRKLIKDNPETIVTFELNKDAMEAAGYTIRDILDELKNMGLDTLYDITHPTVINKIGSLDLLRDFENMEASFKQRNNGHQLIEVLAMTYETSKIYDFLS